MKHIALVIAAITIFISLQLVPQRVRARAISSRGHQKVASYGLPACCFLVTKITRTEPGKPAVLIQYLEHWSLPAFAFNAILFCAVWFAFLASMKRTRWFRRFSTMDLLVAMTAIAIAIPLTGALLSARPMIDAAFGVDWLRAPSALTNLGSCVYSVVVANAFCMAVSSVYNPQKRSENFRRHRRVRL